jgi:hypothetical protein
MTSLQVKPFACDKNDETLYKGKEVTLENKKILTPIVSVDTRLITRREQLAIAIKGLNEIYRRLDSDSLKEVIFNRNRQDDFNNRIETERNKIDFSKEMTICILEYVGDRYPLGRELEFVLDTAYIFSDIVPLPALPRITETIDEKSKFDNYQIYLKEMINFLRRNSKEKPIMGVVPRLAYGFVASLMEFYIDEGINAFYVDFEARNPTTFKQNLLPVFRTLAQYEMADNSFIYAHNVDAGRFIKNTEVVDAKDILSFGFGFDAIGRRHKDKKLPKEYWQKLNTLPNKLRLFNKNDYGYYRISNSSRIREMYPSDSSISIDAFAMGLSESISTLRRYERLFNTEQLGLEAFRIRQIVKDFIPIKYLTHKRYVKKKNIKLIKRFKEDIFKKKHEQKSLFDIDNIL